MLEKPHRFGVIQGVANWPEQPRVVVIGSGVVGTATGLGLAANGAQVTFCDVSLDRIAVLRRRGLATVDAIELARRQFDAYLISVPTPTVDWQVDLSFLVEATATVGAALRSHPGKPLVVVRSTVPPGSTERTVIPLLEESSGLRAGLDFSVAMNPEFLRAATAEDDFAHPRVIVIGALDDESDAAMRRLYRAWADVPTMSMDLVTAESTKYVSNLFNAAKISFFNEMHSALERIGADATAAFGAVRMGAEGMWNPKYGTRGKAPYGGVCLPKDTAGFLGFAATNGFADLMQVLRATIAVNDRLRDEGTPEADFTPASRRAGEDLVLSAEEL